MMGGARELDLQVLTPQDFFNGDQWSIVFWYLVITDRLHSRVLDNYSNFARPRATTTIVYVLGARVLP